MTPRERVLTALEHSVPDRVPIDFGGGQTGIHRLAYQKLIRHLGLVERVETADLVQQLAQPSEAVLERLHVDTRYVWAACPGGLMSQVNQDCVSVGGQLEFTDEFGVTWSICATAPHYCYIKASPLAGLSLEQIKQYPFPKGDDPSRFEDVRNRAISLKHAGRYAIISGDAASLFEMCCRLRGLGNVLTDMIQQPEVIEVLIERVLEFWLGWFRLFLAEVGDVVDIITIADDLGAQEGPLVAPEIYRKIIKPRQQRLVQFIKSRTRAKIWYHSCGAITQFIPDLIESGVDILNPLQSSAKDMDLVRLKAEYGRHLVFWGGGVDASELTQCRTPVQVREAVRRNMEALKPGGGFVFAPAHNIQPDTPPEFILAMFDAAAEHGKY
ncbi:MAG: hypothetical protein N2379_01980 [Verrucomicrobiae bacterium]|nr:hypothetical protein [Verrucomicrobiae bacterium]